MMVRWLVLAIPTNCWQFYLSEVYRVLKPGTGWLQMLELDRDGVGRPYSENNSLPEDSALSKVFSRIMYYETDAQYTEICQAFMDMANLGFEAGKCENYLKAQGFVDIEIKPYLLPIGTWPEGLKILINHS
jgi:hypothetical protein